MRIRSGTFVAVGIGAVAPLKSTRCFSMPCSREQCPAQPAALPNHNRPFPVGPSVGRDKFGYGFEITASNKENSNLREPGRYTWTGIYNTHFWGDPKRGIASGIKFQTLKKPSAGISIELQDWDAWRRSIHHCRYRRNEVNFP